MAKTKQPSKYSIGTFVNYIRESREELKKVVWPTKKELYRHTMVVIAISLGVAFFLGFLDILLQRGMDYII